MACLAARASRCLTARAFIAASCRRLAAEAAPRASGAAGMALTFSSPQQVFFEAADVKQVDVPTLTGSFGVLPHHVPTLAVLKPGVVLVHMHDGSANKFFVSSGSLSVNADSSVQLLAEEAYPLEYFDVQTAKSCLEKAQAELQAAQPGPNQAEARITVETLEVLMKALE
uniref:ATP synthase F(1) complex subunit delta, mitochondrial n=1 Tax=Eptatretus burgeri TaxID=7764 RepID=A0A8C4NCU7_EPTBU